MFFIKKCANCDRYGNVAEKESDKICKLCKDKQKASNKDSNEENTEE